MVTPEKIKSLAAKHKDSVIRIRRHLHMYPELSFKEFKTSLYIAEQLEKTGIPFKTGFARTGILARIEGQNPGRKVIALRADIDALPIEEGNQVSYRSRTDGVMHACGHDVHTSSLLGTAFILKELENEFEGTIMLIFQPGEELLPGGAKQMIDDGVLDHYPRPELILAQHVDPDIEAGRIGFRAGKYMASSDELYLTMRGKGGHAAIPRESSDMVLVASKIIVALKEAVAEKNPGEIPTILSFGKFIAEGATNVIPSEVFIEGTFRTFDEPWRKEAHRLMNVTAVELAGKYGATCDFVVKNGYPFLTNDENITRAARKFCASYIGTDQLTDLDLRMTAEDFAYFSQILPATLYRLGVRNEKKNIASPLHSPAFDIDEDVLELASGNMAWLAISFLSYKPGNRML